MILESLGKSNNIKNCAWKGRPDVGYRASRKKRKGSSRVLSITTWPGESKNWKRIGCLWRWENDFLAKNRHRLTLAVSSNCLTTHRIHQIKLTSFFCCLDSECGLNFKRIFIDQRDHSIRRGQFCKTGHQIQPGMIKE